MRSSLESAVALVTPIPIDDLCRGGATIRLNPANNTSECCSLVFAVRIEKLFNFHEFRRFDFRTLNRTTDDTDCTWSYNTL